MVVYIVVCLYVCLRMQTYLSNLNLPTGMSDFIVRVPSAWETKLDTWKGTIDKILIVTGISAAFLYFNQWRRRNSYQKEVNRTYYVATALLVYAVTLTSYGTITKLCISAGVIFGLGLMLTYSKVVLNRVTQ